MASEAQQLVPMDSPSGAGPADDDANICRVCRMEAGQDRPLFYPCICTGTIKYIHQDCLLQWLQVSRREFCELCGHKYKFKPIYAPDMPSRLPLADIVHSLLASAGRGLAFWLHYSLVACSWLLAVPLLTCRLYRLLLQGGASSGGGGWLANLVSLQGLVTDCCLGGLATGAALLAYFCLVCLREAIGAAAPDWMREDEDLINNDNNNMQHPLLPHQNDANEAILGGLHQGEQVIDEDNVNELAHNHHHDDHNNNNNNNNNNGEAEDEEDGENDENAELIGNNNQQNNNLFQGLQDLLINAFGLEEPAANDDEAAPDAAPDAAAAAAAGNDGQQPDELNWERLLGFDGSPAFVMWLAWVLGVNALFLLLFHYLPLRVGRALVRPVADYLLAAGSDASTAAVDSDRIGAGASANSSSGAVRLPYLADAVCILAGYAALAVALRLGYAALSFAGSLRRYRRLFGTLYLVVKLCLLTALLLALCPLVCGFWLDLGSLRLLNSTMRDRRLAFDSVPGAFLLVHWLLGLLSMIYSFLFFCLFVRDAFRPGLFPAPDGAEINPLVRLVRLPWLATASATVACLAGFGCLSLLLLYLPARLLAVALPGFLPYRVTYSSESDLSFIEFLLWQVAFPAMLDQGHVKASLQSAVHRAIQFAGSVSGLSDFLLARVVEPQQQQQQQQQPTLARIAVFAASLAASAVIGASLCMLCPVLIGRCLLRPFQLDTINELYTAACGLYVCWAILSMGHLIADWLPWNRAQLLGLLRQWACLLAKMLALGALYAAVAPLLLGVLFEKVVMIPLRLPDGCSPVLNLFHCWFTGLLLCKFITGCLFVGPNFRLKAALERLYEEGLGRVPFGFIWRELYCPVLLFLGAPLAGPHLLLHGCVPLFVSDPRVLLEASRHLHFLATSTGAALALIGYEVRQFRRFYQHLVNDRYLVGQRLVNYHPD